MKIGEIFEAMKTEKISELAKRIEGISEKPLRTALKKAGYEYSNKEPKGWHFTGVDEEPLEKSIFDYHEKAKAKNKSKASNNNISAENKIEIRQYSQSVINDDKVENDDSNNKHMSKGENNSMKDEIAMMLQGNGPEKPKKVFKGFYLDENVANVIDSIKTGNKSEFVSKIIMAYLKENDLI